MKTKLVFLLTIISLGPMVLLHAQMSNYEAEGPVKQIAFRISLGAGGSNYSLMYGQPGVKETTDVTDFDPDGRKVLNYNTSSPEDYTVYTYEGQTKYTMSFSPKNRSGELIGVDHLDSLGHSVLCAHMRGDTVYSIDSTVYNRWGKVAMDLESVSFKTPFVLYQSHVYKYDSIGRPIGMRSFSRNNQKKPSGGYEIEYQQNKIIKVFLDKECKPSSRKEITYLDKKGRVVKMQSEYFTTRYMDFDEYGNWRRSETTTRYPDMPSSVQTTFVRDITYYE